MENNTPAFENGEYVTFHVTTKDGKDVEMAVVDEFDIEIIPNVKLADIVNKIEYGDISELDTLISFGIFTKDFKNVLLLINLSNNNIVRSICKKSKISYMEVKTYSLTDLKHIKSRISKALSK
jgi:hypothetical protein